MNAWANRAALLLAWAPALAAAFEPAEAVFHDLSAWRPAEAQAKAEALLQSAPENPYFHYLRSLTRYENGDYAGSLEDARHSSENLPAVEASVRGRLLDHLQYLETAVPLLSGFRRAESEHFVLSYRHPKDSLLLEEALTALEGARRFVGEDLGYAPAEKVRMEIYPDRASFVAVSTLTEDEVKRTGTIALCKFNRLLIISPRAVARGYDWKRTLCHEYVHYAVNKVAGGKIPIWLHEGLAHFEEVRHTGAAGGVMSLLEKDLMFRALQTHSLVPFEKMHPSMAKLKDGEESGTAFAQVFLAVKHIVETAGYEGIRRILRETAAGGNLDSALCRTVRCEGGFEAAVVQYIRRHDFGPVEGVSVPQVEFNEDSPPDEEYLFRTHVRLSEMLLEAKRSHAAREELLRADGKGRRRSPWVLNQVGLLYERNGEPEKALSCFDQSVDRFPDYCNGFFNRAAFLFKKGEFKRARHDLFETLEINPFHSPARKLYIETLKKLGETPELKRQAAILKKIEI